MNATDHIRDAVHRASAYIHKRHVLRYPDDMHRMSAGTTNAFLVLHQKLFGPNPDLTRRFGDRAWEGNTFQVALITDSLIDARHLEPELCDQMICENVARLLGARDAESWRYFPGFDPLPYDADDLGQVAQVLVTSRQGDTTLLDAGFELVKKNAWDDGAVNTWLLDDPAQRMLANKLWGRGRDDSGKDVEVTANVLYGAVLYNATKRDTQLQALVDRGARWVASQQHTFGLWRASWYVGICYSTYAAMRFLRAVGGHEIPIEKAARYLVAAAPSDPLNYALTMLGLREAGLPAPSEYLPYLLETQNPDGLWESVPFIDDHGRVWGSRTITTSFCLRALAAQLRPESAAPAS